MKSDDEEVVAVLASMYVVIGKNQKLKENFRMCLSVEEKVLIMLR